MNEDSSDRYEQSQTETEQSENCSKLNKQSWRVPVKRKTESKTLLKCMKPQKIKQLCFIPKSKLQKALVILNTPDRTESNCSPCFKSILDLRPELQSYCTNNTFPYHLHSLLEESVICLQNNDWPRLSRLALRIASLGCAHVHSIFKHLLVMLLIQPSFWGQNFRHEFLQLLGTDEQTFVAEYLTLS